MTDSLYSDLKYGRFFHVEVHTNGGASIVHMYQNEIDSLSETEMEELTEEFFRVVFSENEDGYAHHVMGIVHDAARYIPDLLEHMADNYSTLTVKAGVLGRNSDIETSTLAQYYEQVAEKYSHGTFRYGPLHQISLVGKVHEEVGGYFPDLLGRLENNPFLKQVNINFIIRFCVGYLITNCWFSFIYQDNAMGRKVNSTNGSTAIEWWSNFMGSTRRTTSSDGWTHKNTYETTKVSAFTVILKTETHFNEPQSNNSIEIKFPPTERALMSFVTYSTYRDSLKQEKQCLKTVQKPMLIM